MFTLIRPAPEPGAEERLAWVLDYALDGFDHETVSRAEELDGLQGRRLLFAVAVGRGGVNLEHERMTARLRCEPELLRGCLGGVLIDGGCELYTKSVGRSLVFSANRAGCAFIGSPLVEATRTLQNFNIQARLRDTDTGEAYRLAARDLVRRLLRQSPPPPIRRLLALHASVRPASNTLALWDLTKTGLDPAVQVDEISLRNGQLVDCCGCSYRTCLHFGERDGCFYGGSMTREVYPALTACDALIMLCANYNDALAANLTACINRMTALFRKQPFYEKQLFALIVSGYSGSDLVAQQLIAALNMNKSFFLPPRFSLMETANDKGSLPRLPGIEERAAAFGRSIR